MPYISLHVTKLYHISYLGMCSFEAADICGYQNSYDTTDKFNWLRSNGPTTSIGTGPVADHTYGTVYGKIYFHNLVRTRSLHLKFLVYDFKNHNRLTVLQARTGKKKTIGL